jgi:hypothetical protein
MKTSELAYALLKLCETEEDYDIKYHDWETKEDRDINYIHLEKKDNSPSRYLVIV